MANTRSTVLTPLQSTAAASWRALMALSRRNPRFLAVLNGLIGDSLEAAESELAIPMTLLGEAEGERVCILVHGLCTSEEIWRFAEEPGKDYGSMLRQEFGYTPLYLRYNTGLHISTNGRRLADLLDAWEQSQHPRWREIVFIGHSMGGLVVRSACHYGEVAGMAWVQKVKKVFFLGTPHLGSDFEKLGHLTSEILDWIPNPVTKGISLIGNRRSAGIKDLRFGYLRDEDWEKSAKGAGRDKRPPLRLLPGVEYYIIAGTVAKERDNIFTRYLGDGVVPWYSATGRSLLKSKSLPFSPANFKTIKGISHGRLTRHPEVYEQIRLWNLENT